MNRDTKTKHPGLGKIIKRALVIIFSIVTCGLFINLVYRFFSQDLARESLHNLVFSLDVGLALFYFLFSLCILLFIKYFKIISQKKTIANLLLSLGSIIFALVLFDLIMAPYSLVFDSANIHGIDFNDRLNHAKKNPHLKEKKEARELWWGKDEQLGYKPLMGENFPYSDLGAIHNGLPAEKRAGKKRILFVGDSITAYGYTMDSLKDLMNDDSYEFWNLGVWGYSTWQELKYFERYGRSLKPDLVVLQFCLNDWDGTPVILEDENGKIVIANLHLGRESFSYWWYKNSTLYRYWASLKASATNRRGTVKDVEECIKRFMEYAKEDGFELRVIVYPELDKYSNWEDGYKRQRRDILDILEGLQLPHYDVMPLLDEVLIDKPRDWVRMRPQDHFHPSREFSKMIAQDILAKDFLPLN